MDYLSNLILSTKTTKDQECIPIYVTGYGYDVYIDKINFFFSLFVPNFIIKKIKQIKAFAKALDYCINNEKNCFYTVSPVEITKLHLIGAGIHINNYTSLNDLIR